MSHPPVGGIRKNKLQDLDSKGLQIPRIVRDMEYRTAMYMFKEILRNGSTMNKDDQNEQ